MKVLFISSQALFSKTRFGGAKRLYYFARELEANMDLHVLCMDGCNEFPDGKPFPQEFRNQLFIRADPIWKLRRRFSFEKFSLLPGIGEIISRNSRAVESFLKNQNFDATLFAFSPSLFFLEKSKLPQMGKLVYLEDDLLLENMWNGAVRGKTWKQRVILFMRYWQSLAFFRHRLENFSSFICISREEKRTIQKLFPFLSTHILKYGIPLDDYDELPLMEEDSVLGFIGNYLHPPNVDALRWLVDDLFPHFSMRIPEARLVLGGKNFPAEILEKCMRNPAIQIIQDVDDLKDFYARIGTFINPIREGRGLRTKVIESAAFGRPILSTTLGAEGLEELRLGTFENKEQLVDAFLFMRQNDHRSEAARHNRIAVENFFSLKKIGHDLEKILTP